MWIDIFVGVENGSLDAGHLRTLKEDGLAYDGSCEWNRIRWLRRQCLC